MYIFSHFFAFPPPTPFVWGNGVVVVVVVPFALS